MWAGVGLWASGCGSGGERAVEFAVPPGRYIETVEVARRVLMEAQFEIDRVDAAAGVLTTHPKSSAGLLTPWITDQSTLEQRVADAANTHRRRVRVTFEPAAVGVPEGPGGQAAADVAGGVWSSVGALDLRESEVALTARVEVYVDRVRRPGLRLETESIRTSRVSLDPSLSARMMNPEYVTSVDRDDLLAARLAERMRRRMEGAGRAGQRRRAERSSPRKSPR